MSCISSAAPSRSDEPPRPNVYPVPVSLPTAMPVPVALDLFTDVSGFVRETLWVVAAIIAATAIMVYILAWMSRYFIYLKAQESRYFDARTLDIIHRVVELLAIAIWLLSVMAIAAIRSPEVRNLLVEFFERFWAVMFAVL